VTQVIKNTIFLIFINSLFLIAQSEHVEIGIDEKLGNFLPLDAVFTNSEGNEVKLKQVIDKPVLLAFVYYECPGICNNTMSELAWVVDRVDLEPEKDFKVITISIDNSETQKTAKIAKSNYLASLKRKFPKSAWEFLVGDSAQIYNVTKAAGFYFKKYGSDYRHPGGLITISPQGKISRYIFGSEFNQFDVKMALIDAQAGKTNPTVAKILQFCFSYDPEGRAYSVNITRIAGSIMLLAIFGFVFFLIKKKKVS
jgi:protein SCO1/2